MQPVKSNSNTNSFDSLSHFQLVGEFHDVFGHPQRKTLYEDCFEVEPKLVPFRISLINEELNEFKDAYSKNDVIEMADALCDLSYVTNGAGHCLGVDLDNLMIKMYNVTHFLRIHDKTEPLDLENADTRQIVDDGLKLIQEAVTNFCASSETQDLGEMAEYLVEILRATYDLGYSLNFDMDSMFREVHRSNMSKVCNNVEDAKKSIEYYETENRYKKPTIRVKGKYFVIFDDETSKILKNYKWNQPNLKQFI